MKKVTILAIFLALVETMSPVYGEEMGNSGVDFQLRIPFHLQYVPESWNKNKGTEFGIAGWAILPDVMAKNNNTASFLVFGPLIKYGEGNWVEIMGGSRINDDGYIDPLINLRFLEKRIPRLNVFGDVEYFPGEKRQRLYSLFSADTPLNLGKYVVRVGVESEDIFSFSGKKDSLGIGPRIVLPLPKKMSPFLTSSLTIAYQCRSDRDFLRCYLTFTYQSSGKKGNL